MTQRPGIPDHASSAARESPAPHHPRDLLISLQKPRRWLDGDPVFWELARVIPGPTPSGAPGGGSARPASLTHNQVRSWQTEV